jgi:hypothetical protein
MTWLNMVRSYSCPWWDPEWSEKLDTALTAARRDDLQHGTNAAYVNGCVYNECREYQRVRMAQNPN